MIANPWLAWLGNHRRLRLAVRLYCSLVMWYWLALIALGIVHLITDIPLIATGRDLWGFGWAGRHIPFGLLFAVAAWAASPGLLLPSGGEKPDPWWKRVGQAAFCVVLGMVFFGLLPTSVLNLYLLYLAAKWSQVPNLIEYWRVTKERRRQWALEEKARSRQWLLEQETRHRG